MRWCGRPGSAASPGSCCPREYGGAAPATSSSPASSRRWRGSAPAARSSSTSTSASAASPCCSSAMQAQLRRHLPAIASGRHTAAFALTEPGSGSDAGRPVHPRRARRRRVPAHRHQGVHHQLRRRRRVPRDGAHRPRDARHHRVRRRRDEPGLRAGAPLHKMGLAGSWTAELVLDGVSVDAADRLGEEGMGFRVAMAALDSGRVGISAQAVGIAQGCIDDVVRRSPRHRRRVDETLLADIQARTVGGPVPDRARRRLADAASRSRATPPIAKLYATDTCVAAAIAAVDMCAPESARATTIPPRSGCATPRRARSTRAPTRCSAWSSPEPLRAWLRGATARAPAAHNPPGSRRPPGPCGALTTWTFVSTRSSSSSSRACASSPATASRRAPARSTRRVSSPGTSSRCSAPTTSSRCPFPPEYGGLSGSALTLNVAIEEVAKACATSALILAVQALGAYPIMLGGSDEQKQRFLPDLASGRKLAAYALTEPGAGSDPGGMETRATRQGDDYVITGSKIWITDGGVADTIVVFAKTDPKGGARGVSAFVLDNARELDGFTATAIHGKLGIRGSNTAELHFDEVRGAGRQPAGRGGQRLRPCHARPRPLASRRGRAGAGHRPGRARLRGGLRARAQAVRQGDRGVPGDPVHDRRHGGADRRGARRSCTTPRS